MKRWTRTGLIIFVMAGLSILQTPRLAQADDDDQKKLTVTVAFGVGLNTLAAANHHVLPQTIRVRAGGVVHFAISGFHQIFVYNPGTKPEHLVVPPFPTPIAGENLFINDFNNLYYRGLNPAGATAAMAAGANPAGPPVNLFNRDNTGNRVESVAFPKPGTYLVICNVTPHFQDGMIAWVKVSGGDDDDDD